MGAIGGTIAQPASRHHVSPSPVVVLGNSHTRVTASGGRKLGSPWRPFPEALSVW